MSNPLNPSFRKPHNIPQEAAHPLVRQAIRDNDKSITDLNQAIASLKGQVTAATTAAASTTNVTENISAETTAGTVTGGVVNNQIGVAGYTVLQSDNASLVLLGDSTPISVTLNPVTIPFTTILSDRDSSSATIIPSLGSINGGSSIVLPGGSWVQLYYDGNDWWSDSPGSTAGGVTQLIAGANITLTPPSGVGIVQIDAIGSGGLTLGGVITTANVVLGTGAGAGATVVVSGFDGSHSIGLTTGTGPVMGAVIFTLTFTTSRGHVVVPVFSTANGAVSPSGFDQSPQIAAASATSYEFVNGVTTALNASSFYIWNILAL